MSSFRPGPVPSGVEVKRPTWPTFTPSKPVAAASPPRTVAASWPPTGLPQTATAAAGRPAPPPAVAYSPSPHDSLNQARLEAARVLQEAASEAEQALAQAREQGFTQGREEGIAAGKAEMNGMRQQAQMELENARLQAENTRQGAEAAAQVTRAEADKEAQATIAAAHEEARRLLDEGKMEVQKRLDESQQALVELAVAAALRIVQGQLALQPQSIVGMVAAGLRRLKDTNCSVRIGPEDLPLLEAQRSTLERELGAGSLSLVNDPSLQPGSYLITSPQGQIDGTLTHQAERIQTALQAALGGKQP